MTPENQQTVYTVLDVLAALPVLAIFLYMIGGMFTGVVNATLTRPWSFIGIFSIAWLTLRAFEVVA
jgi:hypothetical protein